MQVGVEFVLDPLVVLDSVHDLRRDHWVLRLRSLFRYIALIHFLSSLADLEGLLVRSEEEWQLLLASEALVDS